MGNPIMVCPDCGAEATTIITHGNGRRRCSRCWDREMGRQQDNDRSWQQVRWIVSAIIIAAILLVVVT